jgi:hypothetical protein
VTPPQVDDDDAADAGSAPRRWVWMDRWDPGTWETPQNPSGLVRAMAAVALVIVLVMVFYMPLHILGLV